MSDDLSDQPPTPSRSTVIKKSVFFGAVFGTVLDILLYFFDCMEDTNLTTRQKIETLSAVFLATIAVSILYGVWRPHECGESEPHDENDNIRTPTVVASGFFAEANNQGATTADPLLSHQQHDDRDLTPRH